MFESFDALRDEPEDEAESTSTVAAETVQCFCAMSDLMIFENPGLYTDLSSKLNTPLQEERVVCKAFMDFAEALFNRGTSWPLIISFLTFAGSLAAECSRNGRSILVGSIKDWTTIFVVLKLKDWIAQNGNLLGLVRFVSPGTANRVTAEPANSPAKMTFEEFTGLMYAKAGALYSKLDEMSHEERIHRITVMIGVMFVVLNVLWIILVR